jgi:putative tricarboxylic transport membrane protein
VSSLATKGAKGELVFTSFLFALSLIILWDTTQLTESALTGSVSPKAFAYGVGGLLFVLSLIQIVQVLRGKLGEPEGIDGGVAAPKANWKALGLVIGAIVLHIVLLPVLGFMIASTALFFLVAFALGEKRWIKLLIISAVLSVAIYFGFTQGLQLDLPMGFEFTQSTPAEEEW